MAVAYVIDKGDMETQVVWKSAKNLAALLSDEGGTLTDPADYAVGFSRGIQQFRAQANTMFSQFDSDLTVAGLVTLDGGDSWLDIRDKLNTNFGLVDAVVNP